MNALWPGILIQRKNPVGNVHLRQCIGEEGPIYRLGKLYFFEGQRYSHKPARRQLFHNFWDS